MANTINVGMDVSDLKSAAKELESALNTGSSATLKLATSMVDFTTKGNKTRATVQAITEDGTKLTAVVQQTAAGFQVLSVKADSASNSLKEVDQAIKQAGASTEKFGISFAGVVRLFTTQIIRRAIGNIIDDFQKGIAEAQKFSIEIARIDGIIQNADKSTVQWSKEISNLSNEFGTDQVKVAQAAYVALQSQVGKNADSSAFLATALKFGNTVNLEASESAKLLTNTLSAFRLPAADAEKVASTLFNTIANGNVSAQELASQLQRLASTSGGTGIKLEEIAAAIESLTNKGVKFSDAAAGINSLIGQTIKPTAELKKAFLEMGATSGEVFIQMKGGLGGFLKFLDDEAQNGSQRLGELVGSFRNVRTTLNLTGNAFDDYNTALEKATTNTSAFNGAAAKVQQSTGQQIKVELNKIGNFFTNELGGRLSEGILLALQNLTGSGGIGAAIGSTFGGAVGGNLLSLLDSPNDRRAGAEAREKRRQDNDSGRGNLEKSQQDELVRVVQDSYNDRYKIIFDYTAQVVKLGEEARQKSIDDLKQINDQVKITGKTYTDSLSKGISDLRKNVTDANTEINKSKKVLEDLGRAADQRIFNVKERFAARAENDGRGNIAPTRIIDGQNVGADQSITLAQERADKLLEDAKAKFKEGTKESVDEARRLFKEVEALQENIFTKGIENQKKALDDAVKNGFAPGSINQPRSNRIDKDGFSIPDDGIVQSSQVQRRVGPDGQVRFDLLVKTSALEEKINSIKQLQVDLEKQSQEIQKQKIADAEKLIEQEKERLRTVQQGLQDAAKFSVFDKDGKVKKEFQGKEGPEKASDQFQGIVDKITTAAGPDAVKGQFQFFTDLYKQRLAVVQEVETAIRSEQVKTAQQETVAQKKKIDDLTKDATTNFGKNKDTINQQFQKIAGSTEVIGSKGLSTGRELNSDENGIIGTLIGLGQRAFKNGDKEDFQVGKSEKARDDALAKLADFQKAFADTQQTRTAESAKILLQKAQELEAAGAKYVQERTGQNTNEVAIPGDRSGRTADQIFAEPVQAAQKIIDAIANNAKIQEGLKEAGARALSLQDTVGAISEKFTGLGPAAQIGANAIKQQTEAIKTDIQSVVDKVNEVNTALKNLRLQQSENAAPTEAVEGKMMGGPISYFAKGGKVFKPRGSDTIPAMLAPNEFVVNAQAAQQFRPQLEAMNNFQQPRYMASGGSVTNVGDINVNVNGGSTSTQTVREIATGLRRELRRGTVTLK